MESKDYTNFTIKLNEAETLFSKLSTEEKERAFKIILTFKAKCTEAVNKSQNALYKKEKSIPKTKEKSSTLKTKQDREQAIRTSRRKSAQNIGDVCSEENLNNDKFIRTYLDDILTDVFQLVEDKGKAWPQKRLRKRKASLPIQDVKIEETDDFEDPLSHYDHGTPVDDPNDEDFLPNEIDDVPQKKKRRHSESRRTHRSVKKTKTEIKSKEVVGNNNSDLHEPVILKIGKEAVKMASIIKEKKKSGVMTRNGGTKKKSFRKRIGRPPTRTLYCCVDCLQTYTQSISYFEHVTSHGHSPQSCITCMKEFGTAKEYKEHVCTESNFKKCCYCTHKTVRFLSNKKLKEHVKSVHPNKMVARKYDCKFCKKIFSARSCLYQHYKLHSEGKEVCQRCGEFCDGEAALQEHMKIHDPNFKCEKCEMAFCFPRQYDAHLMEHLERDCSLCSQIFENRNELARHYKDEHTIHIDTVLYQLKKQKHLCSECDKTFERPSALSIHKRLHTGERPVECKPCGQFFRTTKALCKHKQTYSHTLKAGETPKERKFLCSICGKAYFRKHALQRHMRYHSGEKPHTCQHCGYQCREANNLKRHMSLHFEAERNFVCELCGSAFHAKKTLEMHHAYKHSDIREFNCHLCNLKFKAKNALIRHYKVHSTEKEHKCWCGTAFKRMYNLRRHLKSVHGGDTILPPVRRVQPLDQPTKAPVSKTDLQNPNGIAEKKEKVPKQRKKPYQNMNRARANQTEATYQPVTTTAIVEQISQAVSDNLKFVPPGLMNLDQKGMQTQPKDRLYRMADVEHCYSIQHNSPTTVASPQRPQQTIIIQQQPTPHSQQPESTMMLHSDDGQQGLRFTGNPEDHGYANGMERPVTVQHNIDPNDPFMQHMNTSIGNPNFIPQAVAYSTIMREYGSQFPFLPDGSNYQNYVNKPV